MDLLNYYSFFAEFKEHDILTYTSISITRNNEDFIDVQNRIGIGTLIAIADLSISSISIKTLHNEFIKYINRAITIMKRNNRERCFIYIAAPSSCNYMKIILSKAEVERLIKESEHVTNLSFYYPSNGEREFDLTGKIEKVII